MRTHKTNHGDVIIKLVNIILWQAFIVNNISDHTSMYLEPYWYKYKFLKT